MTARAYFTIWCDAFNGDGDRCVEFCETGERTATAAKKEARREGWSCIRGGDLCPTHKLGLRGAA